MTYYYESELYHHGIKGQKWGIRRYQNEDGTLTELGKKRYDVGEELIKKQRKNWIIFPTVRSKKKGTNIIESIRMEMQMTLMMCGSDLMRKRKTSKTNGKPSMMQKHKN